MNTTFYVIWNIIFWIITNIQFRDIFSSKQKYVIHFKSTSWSSTYFSEDIWHIGKEKRSNTNVKRISKESKCTVLFCYPCEMPIFKFSTCTSNSNDFTGWYSQPDMHINIQKGDRQWVNYPSLTRVEASETLVSFLWQVSLKYFHTARWWMEFLGGCQLPWQSFDACNFVYFCVIGSNCWPFIPSN